MLDINQNIVIDLVYLLMLLASCGYAAYRGGRTGRYGAVIFMIASFSTLTISGSDLSLDYRLVAFFFVDLACWLALVVLASRSNVFWPIWAVGLQTVSLATHFTIVLIPEFIAEIYQALLSFWAIPILLLMVLGISQDRIAMQKMEFYDG